MRTKDEGQIDFRAQRHPIERVFWIGITKPNDVNIVPPAVEMSRDHQTISTVVPFPANNYHSSLDAEVAKCFRTAVARIFHKHDLQHAKILDRLLVDAADLLTS